ncbi:group-specific protein [Bacillus pseudomycoides]|nr:group-specific protein [Bacillus pseudomycoides]
MIIVQIGKKTYSFFQRIWRVLKFHYYKLLRSPEGAKKVSRGFAIGFALEMLVIYTASLVYLIFYPIVRLAKGSFPAAVIGNIIGKISFLPVILFPFAYALGKTLYPFEIKVIQHKPYTISDLFSSNIFIMLKSLLQSEVYVLIGMTIFGGVFGVISYFVVHYLYEKNRKLRLKKRKKRAREPLVQI